MKTKLLLVQLQVTVSAVFLVIILQLELTSGSLTPCNDGQSSDPQPPDCFDDCEGLRFFLDRDGLCKMCVQCEPGFGHNKYCGDGENGDAVCVPCPEDHYSYNHYDCVACRLCENTVIDQECSFSTDRVCGECLPGFYKDPQNPDLCNQKCEKLSNPRMIPACKVWLENQQVTTVATITSWMSSLPLYPDHVARGVSTRVVIIIILLAVVLIGGSVIPVYVCYKHCRNDRKPSSETVLGDVETHSYPDETHGREDHGLSDSGSIGGIVIVANNHTGVKAMVVDTVPLVTAGQCQTQEQTLSGGSGENVEDDKDCEKTVLEAFHSANEINYPEGSSILQRKEHPTCGNSEIPLPYVNKTDSDHKVVDDLKENGNSSSDFHPFLNSHCRDSGKPPLEISEGLCVSDTCDHPSSSRRLEQDIVNGLETSDGGSPIFSIESDVAPTNVGGGREEEGNSCKAVPYEKQTLLSDATLQCTSTNVIGLDEDNLQTETSDLDGAQRNNMRLGFEENYAKREELECLLPDPDSNYQHGEGKQENLIASANAKKSQPTKENRKDDSSKNGSFRSGMSENARTLRSSEDNESVPLHLGSGDTKDSLDGPANGEEAVDSRSREETDEYQRLLPDKQEEKVGGDVSGGDGTGWRGSAEEETRRPRDGEGKDAPLEMNLDFPAQHGSNDKPQKLILNITGPVTNLVIGNQTHNYNNAGPPQ
ncbi:uncharacterized protein LOC129262130 [Lytechinus pictus]|uniref:uncharacterized protein LOC129262130 n=1 Tax=Lytechinus pictus TaxID=7653 RepID=UPI0030B9E7CA